MSRLDKIIKESENNPKLEQLLRELMALGYQLNNNSKNNIDVVRYVGRYFIKFPWTGISVSRIKAMTFLTDKMSFVNHAHISKCIMLDTQISISMLW